MVVEGGDLEDLTREERLRKGESTENLRGGGLRGSPP